MPYSTLTAKDGHTAAVHYGLVNVVFNTPSADSSRTGVLLLTIPASMPATGTPQAQWIPAKIVNGIPQPLTGAARQAELADFDKGLSRCPAVRG